MSTASFSSLKITIILIAVCACLTALGAFFNIQESWSSAVFNTQTDTWALILDIRLPRGLGAWSAGALLGLSGALAQGLFRNPLADPFLLGSATGASLGVLSLLASWSYAPIAWSVLQGLGLTGAAFLGALLAVLLSVALAGGIDSGLRLLLSGLVVGVVLGAVSSLVLALNPQLLVSMQGFMLGSTVFLGWSSLGVLLICLALCLPIAWWTGRYLDALVLGESTAQSLGFAPKRLRWLCIGLIALSSGAAVAQTGLIAFVGLAAPHWVRTWGHAQHRSLVLLSALMGGVLLQGADFLARVLIAPSELPVGVLTALLGGVYLLVLMQNRKLHSL